MPMVKKHDSSIRELVIDETQDVGLSLFDIKRRQGTKGSVYDARSLGGIRAKGKKRKPPNGGNGYA